MNTFMWDSPFTAAHLDALQKLGVTIIPPVRRFEMSKNSENLDAAIAMKVVHSQLLDHPQSCARLLGLTEGVKGSNQAAPASVSC